MKLIRSPWKQVIQAIIGGTQLHFGRWLHSVYVRGSVAKGKAICGVSDLDMTAVIGRLLSKSDFEWRDEFLAQISKTASFISSIELPLYTRNQLLNRPGHERERFFLKTQSVCVCGDDLAVTIKDFAPSRRTIFYASSLTERLNYATACLRTCTDTERTCRWIMKNIVRAGFEIVMEREGKYTRDLYPCYRAFSRHYPELSDQMRRALKLAIEPTQDVSRIREIIDGLGVRLALEWSKNPK